MSKGSLAGRRAWITGGGSGIGAAIACALAAEGAAVTVSGRREEALRSTVAAIQGEGGSALALPLDVADASSVQSAVQGLGHADILVACAGSNVVRRRLSVLDAEGWRQVMGANLDGAFNAVRAVLPEMRLNGGGLIVLVSSWAGWRFEPVAGAAYSASKRALGALAEAISAEEGANGIRATCLCPAETDTDVLDTRPNPPTPEQRSTMLQAADIAAVVVALARLPARICINELVISPARNAFYGA